MSVTISILMFSVICYPIVFPLKVHFSIPTLLNANFGLCCRLLSIWKDWDCQVAGSRSLLIYMLAKFCVDDGGYFIEAN